MRIGSIWNIKAFTAYWRIDNQRIFLPSFVKIPVCVSVIVKKNKPGRVKRSRFAVLRKRWQAQTNGTKILRRETLLRLDCPDQRISCRRLYCCRLGSSWGNAFKKRIMGGGKGGGGRGVWSKLVRTNFESAGHTVAMVCQETDNNVLTNGRAGFWYHDYVTIVTSSDKEWL